MDHHVDQVSSLNMTPVLPVDYIELNEKNAAAVAAAGGQQAAGVPQSHLLHSMYSRNPAMFGGTGQQAAAMAAWAASSSNSHYQAWLPDGYSQFLYAFGPSGLNDYGSATLRYIM